MKTYFICLFCLLVFVIFLSFFTGSVIIPFSAIFKILLGNGDIFPIWEQIIFEFRIPKTIVAVLAGIALSVSGLQMQTLFSNSLAGPFVLGINSGASLGVALIVLATGLHLVTSKHIEIFKSFHLLFAAIIGAIFALGIILWSAQRIKNSVTILIIGLILGMVINSFISILIYFSDPEEIQSYLIWTFGSFRGVTWENVILFIIIIGIGLFICLITLKHLNVILVGEKYALSLGVPLKKIRNLMMISTGILAGTTTAFCGPIAFIGIAVPHIARGLFQTSNHRILFPAVILIGGILALIAEIISQLPGSEKTLPLNAIMALCGGPVIIWVILKRKQITTV